MEHGQKPAKGKVGTCIAEREELQLLRPLQYCRERETTIATTAPVLQTARNCNHYDRSIIAKRGELQLPRPFQCCRERNCNYYYNRSSIAEKETVIIATLPVLQKREKLELLGQDPSSIAEIETVITATLPAWQRGKLQLTTTTAPVLQRDTCTGTPRPYR